MMDAVQDTNDVPHEEAVENNSSASVENVREDSDAEEEEDECRVCRGPAEEGRPLFAPCKCSGSIGLTHQECLMSWLEVTRGDGRCELCKTKFRFDPQYADNAPDRLPAPEVMLGLSSRFLAKWLPLALRIFIAASLWLLVAPLLTAYLYHGWMHRPSSVLTRWKRELIPSDIVSGAIVAAIIIISFLSLMSFADFLRVHWQQQADRLGEENGEQPRRNDMANGFGDDDNINNEIEGGVDEAIVEHIGQHLPLLDQDQAEENSQRENPLQEDAPFEPKDRDSERDDADRLRLETQATRGHELAMLREARRHNEAIEQEEDDDIDEDKDDEGIDGDANGGMEGQVPLIGHEDYDSGGESDDDDLPAPMFPRGDFFRDEGDNIMDIDDEDEIDRNNEPDFPPLNDGGDRPFDPMDPVLQDDQVDMEINVALDELLGLRGPLSTLIRNLLWLLAFNATYLGIFAFVPRTVGSAVNAGLLNTTLRNKLLNTLPYVHSDDPEQLTVLSTFASLNEESSQRDTTFRLPDVATVTLGYFSIATMIVLMRYGWVVSQKFRQRFSLEGTRINTNERQEAHPARFHERMMPNVDDRDVVEPGAANTAIGIALDATVAVVKVGILLFLKMFLLPLVLGLWLDVSTMPLFGHTIADRASFAGGDLFSFVLLHWVAGITFMLLVTVFLLQLREVTHPDLLARLIRPQEPQPDLLGNLMHETVSTHIKRMALSLGIYAPLLTMHITLPVKLFIASGLGNRFTFFHLNFWHIVLPQMQIPLELIIFHLSMLALLERYKNSIGGLQHSWMVFMCQKMGLTEYVLPHSVAKFELVGTKEIFLPERDGVDKGPLKTVDPFWYELAAKKKDVDSFVEANIQRISTDSPKRVAEGETKANGDRVLTESLDFIRLPSNGEEDKGDGKKSLLRTKIGRFRLNRVDFDDLSTPVIEFWREVPGGEIDRPPVGWDDLGAGGAFVQGRWAWGKERKSVIEGTVAERTPFRASESQGQPLHLMLKVAALFVLSWVAITVTVLGFVSAPLAVGRSLYYLFRIPQNYIHDPLAFVIGACLFFPMMSLLMRTINLAEGKPTERLSEWISGFHLPPRQKVLVFLESWILWIVLAPMALGISYEIAAVKTSKWFGREEQLADIHSILVCWILGISVLHAWAFFAYYSVFTKQFWRNIGNGILEPPLDENGAGPAGNVRNRGGENMEQAEDDLNTPHLSWQGKDGRVARFFNVWRSAILDWDWERVDRTTLLEEFARPISKQLASALVGSSLSFQFSLYLASLIACFEQGGIVVPFLGVIERGLFRMAVFRICMATHVIVQLCSAFRGRLEGWFQAAHGAARDDRYLIGEVLMNYNADDEDYNAAVR